MTDYGIGGHRSIDEYVKAKLDSFSSREKTFETLFDLMFSESGNVMWEQSEGFRIREFTYGQVKNEIIRKAASLSSLLSDLPRGSVVGLYMENSLEWIECFWAIILGGFNPLLLNLRLPDAALNDALTVTGCGAVISSGKKFSRRTVLPTEIEADETENAPVSEFGKEILIMSSGTSGRVKICAYTALEFYFQISDSCRMVEQCALLKKHYECRLKLLALLPFYHIFGLTAVYVWFSFFSRTFVHLSDLSPETVVNTIKRHKVTHIFVVPLFWEKVYKAAIKTIKKRGEKTYAKFCKAIKIRKKLNGPAGKVFSALAFREVRENLFGDSISFLITGGSRIDPDVIGFFNIIGYRLANGYGMTEIGITSVELTSGDFLYEGFVGAPFLNAEYSINDRGELLVRGKVIASYIIEGGIKTHTDGWFNTRDLAECVSGHYRILGRSDDLIVGANGENVNPSVVEPLLRPEGAEDVCLIKEKAGDSEEPVLLVSVNRFISSEKLESIEKETKRLVSDAKLASSIKRIVFVTCPLLRDDEFKLNRKRLSVDFSAGLLPTTDREKSEAEGEDDELISRIKSFISAALDLPLGDIHSDSDFFTDLGGSSLDYFAVVSQLEDDLGVPFPSDGENGLKTARGFADFVRKEKNL